MDQIAEARTVDEMLAAYRQRLAQLQVTYGEVDRVSTLADGHTSKLLGVKPAKNLGPFSFQALNTTLGVKWIMVEDQGNVERFVSQLKKAASPGMLRVGKQAITIIKITPKHMKKLGVLGNKARNQKIPPWRRRQIARRAARKRWRKGQAIVASPPVPVLQTKP